MKVQLAIYDALVKAKIPHESAKEVAEALETDMNQLATKQDLQTLEARLTAKLYQMMLLQGITIVGLIVTLQKLLG